MSDRSVLEVVLQERDGDARANVALTFRQSDNSTPIAQTIYNAVSGGSAVLSPTTNTNGTFRGWVDNPQAAYVLSADDGVSTPIAAWPSNPADLILSRQSDASIATLGVGASTALTAAAPFQARSTYNGWTGSVITTTQAGAFGAIGSITLADVLRTRDTPDVAYIGAVVGAVNVPAGTTALATNSQGIGVLGFAKSAGVRNAVALYGEAQATATSAATGGGYWGVNTIASDMGFACNGGAGIAGLYGAELSVTQDHASTIAWGVHTIGDGAAVGTSAAGFGSGTFHDSSRGYSLSRFATTSAKWHYGLRFDHGATLFGLSLGFQTNTAVAATGSQVIMFDSQDAGLVTRNGYVLANSDGDLLLRPGSGVTRIQAAQNDQTAAGTSYVTVNSAGLGVGVTPAKVLEGYSAVVGFPINLRLTNYDSTAASGVVLGFEATGGAEARGAKGGFGFERTATFGRGKLHVLQRNDANATEIALASSVGFFAPDGGWVVGATGTSGGTGTLAILNTLYVNDSANAKMTQGLTLNQGANDDEILAFKSSDVTQGATDEAEADTYGLMKKNVGGNGGLAIYGFDDTAQIGLRLRGIGTTADGTYTTAGGAAVIIDGHLISGTALASLGADKSILAVRDNGTARFFLDSDGDSHQDVGTAWTNFHGHDDIGLVTALAANVTRPDDPIRRDFGDFLFDRRADLERLRLVTFNEDGRHFVNMSRLTMLLVGAIQQIDARFAVIESQMQALTAAS